jgi:hypothetical protein
MALTDFVAGQVLTAQQLDDSFAAVDWNENVIINGAMQVAQRATSSAGITASGYFTADRWNTELITLGTWTQSVEADAPTGSGFRNSLKMLCTTADASPAASDLLNVQQRSEGLNVQQFAKGTASAKTFCMSFWVKSNVTGTYIVQLLDVPNSRSVSASYTISAAATWEKKTITFPADVTGAFANTSGQNLQTRFWLAAGSDRTSGTLQTTWGSSVTTTGYAVGQTNLASAINNYWQVTGVQVQPERASQFAFLNYGEVLAQCQRYFIKYTSEAAAFTAWTLGLATSGTAANAFFALPVTMRAAPDALTYTTLGVAEGGLGLIAVTAANLQYVSDKTFSIGLSVAAGLTQHRPIQLFSNNSTSAFVAVSAEI